MRELSLPFFHAGNLSCAPAFFPPASSVIVLVVMIGGCRFPLPRTAARIHFPSVIFSPLQSIGVGSHSSGFRSPVPSPTRLSVHTSAPSVHKARRAHPALDSISDIFLLETRYWRRRKRSDEVAVPQPLIASFPVGIAHSLSGGGGGSCCDGFGCSLCLNWRMRFWPSGRRRVSPSPCGSRVTSALLRAPLLSVRDHL